VAATDVEVTDACITALAQNFQSPSNVWHSTQGCAALIYAAGSRHLDVVRCLASDHGAKIGATAAEGCTALMVAAGSGHLDVALHAYMRPTVVILTLSDILPAMAGGLQQPS
jgi:hypothetical protein